MNEWPRRAGKAIIRRVVQDMELAEGRHVHTVSHSQDEMCQGGDSECPLFLTQLEEAMETWCE